MTFDKLVRDVAAEHKVPNWKARSIINSALQKLVEAAKTNSAPRLTGIGRIVTRPVRMNGRTPTGARWSKPYRVKLAIATRESVEVKQPEAVPARTGTEG